MVLHAGGEDAGAPIASSLSAPRLSGPLSPVHDAERLTAMDVARGVALFGILLVNMAAFAEPLGHTFAGPPTEGSAADLGSYYLVTIFFQGKFYPLFALLFGMGIAVQASRARTAGRSFGLVMARRCAVLGLIGAAHAIFLWYGDVLFIYAWIGAIVAFCAGWRARTLLVTGTIILIVAAALTGLLMGAGMSGLAEARAASAGAVSASGAVDDQSQEPVERPFGALLRLMQDGEAEPWGEAWMALETEVYRNGPYLDAVGFRVISWGIGLLTSIVSIGWMILGMFLIGAGLMRADIFSPAMRLWHWRFVLMAVTVGLPIAIAGAIAARTLGPAGEALEAIAMIAGGPIVSLGYLGACTLVVMSGRWQRVTSIFATAGRMALTGYLLQTVLVTAVMYHWGFGLFGQVSRPQQLVLAIAVYAVAAAFSIAWLERFTMGPMEYLWRAATYCKPLPLVRR